MNLSFCRINNDQLNYLSQFFSDCINLRSLCLNISQNEISDNGLVELFSSLSTLNYLESLHLSCVGN